MTAVILGLGVTSPLPEAASTRRPAVRIENDLMINSRAGYYFKVPEGWILDSSSTYEFAKVVHPETGAAFSVFYSRGSGGNLNMYFMTMKMALESPDMHWLTMGQGPVTLGGGEAVGFRGTREEDGRKVKEFDWIALHEGYAYILGARVDLDKFEGRAAEIDQMFSSFSWGAPPKSP